MSFDTKKIIYGEHLSSGVSIFPNACRYTVDGAFDKRGVSFAVTIAAGYTGNLVVSGGEPLFFISSDPYLIVEDEIIKITVVDATNITIVERAKFGTSDVEHLAGVAKVVHSGEADGSCLGYPKRPDGGGCSTNDSFSRDAEREFLFIDGQSFDGQVYYNGLKSLNHQPCEVKPGAAMAKNASNSVTINDNTDDDVYSVPYPDRRTSNATLFKKLLARTGGYLQNRRAIVYTGFESNGNFSKDDCVAREYVIDSVSLNNSQFNIKLLDPLMLAEASKAKIPTVSGGKLLNIIDGASTTIELKDFVSGEYGVDTTAVTLKIDDELIDCTVTDSATGTFAIVTRQLGGSTLKDHAVNASAQLVKVLINFNPITEIVAALQQTNIPNRFYGDYSAAIANTPTATGPVYIYKPDSTEKYINNIIRTWAQSNITLYFDERVQLIKIKVVGDFEQQPVTFDYREDIKQESLSIKPHYAKQLTRSSIGFAPFNAAKKTDEENSSIFFQSINVLTELTGTLEPQSGKDFYTQFLSNSDTDVQIAVSGTAREASLNVKVPEIFTFKIDYSNFGAVTGGLIEEGEIINVTSNDTVDDFGLPKANNLQILSLKDNFKEATYTVKAITYQDIINEDDFDFIIDEDKENYDLSTEFAPASAGQYIIFITSGTTIGSTSVGVDAFTTGVQSAGVTFKIIFRGGTLGAGGAGVDARDALAANPNDLPELVEKDGRNGLSGGNALNLTVPCIIDVSQGVIFSGGGGSPSSRTTANSLPPTEYVIGGIGGSGGQGYVGGGKGFGGTAEVDNSIIDIGQDGSIGARAAPGFVGALYAGNYGESSGTRFDTGDAGLAGYAIRSNGNSITIIGDNNLTIKGRRDF
jgi:hypothetical protein